MNMKKPGEPLFLGKGQKRGDFEFKFKYFLQYGQDYKYVVVLFHEINFQFNAETLSTAGGLALGVMLTQNSFI